jgi:hypothetical protein
MGASDYFRKTWGEVGRKMRPPQVIRELMIAQVPLRAPLESLGVGVVELGRW